MKPKAAAAAVLLLLSCAAARAQGKPVELIDEYVGIRFEPPKGAKRLSAEETARDFHVPGSRLRVVFNDPKNTMIITVDVFDAEAYGLSTGPANDNQQALRQALESEVMTGVPDAEWMSRDVIKINSLPWLRLRYKFSSGEMVMDMYAIVWGEKYMTVHYGCTAGNYERLRADFEKSAASIQLFITVPVENAKPAGRRGKRKRKP
jgi:hypothetical protein